MNKAAGWRMRARNLADYLDAAMPLSLALSRSRLSVSPEIRLAADVGEKTGTLSQSLKKALQQVSDFDRLLGSLFAKVSYLSVVFFVMFMILTFLMLKIIPTFQQMFQEFGMQLPAMTQLLISVSSWFVRYWFILLPVLWLIGFVADRSAPLVSGDFCCGVCRLWAVSSQPSTMLRYCSCWRWPCGKSVLWSAAWSYWRPIPARHECGTVCTRRFARSPTGAIGARRCSMPDSSPERKSGGLQVGRTGWQPGLGTGRDGRRHGASEFLPHAGGAEFPVSAADPGMRNVRLVRRRGDVTATVHTHRGIGMIPMLSCKRHRRSGVSMAEMIVTVAITMLVMVSGMQLITLAARQGGAIENHRLASLEAGNIMEQIMCRPWDEVTSEGLSSLPLSEACRQALPAASLHVAVDTDGTDQDATTHHRPVGLGGEFGTPQQAGSPGGVAVSQSGGPAMRSIRRGFTLVEMLAVMAVFSVTMSVIILTLHALQKAGDRAHANMSAGVELDRFATQLRTDAHAARTFTLSPTEPANSAASVLTLTLPDQQIVEYQLTADQIQRLSVLATWTNTASPTAYGRCSKKAGR